MTTKTKAVAAKTTADILAERLAELSADIKPKVGKQTRERAAGIASGHIRAEKTRLEAEFAAWVAQGLLMKMPGDEAKIWHDYDAAATAMIAREEKAGRTRDHYSLYAGLKKERLSFPQFYTGERYESNAIDKMLDNADKLPGYAKKKAALDARLAELDAIMDATRKAIWRTHRERGEITVSGNDIGLTVAEIVTQAIGVPMLAAPAIEPDAVDYVA